MINIALMKRLIYLFLFFVLSAPALMAQCPMCKTAVESNLNNEGATAGLGLNDGILYLLGAPYILIAIVGIFWYRNKRKSAEDVYQQG